jgi:hypothetical protein
VKKQGTISGSGEILGRVYQRGSRRGSLGRPCIPMKLASRGARRSPWDRGAKKRDRSVL